MWPVFIDSDVPPFIMSGAGALAQRLADLVKARHLPPGCTLWHYAVDQLLVRAVDSHTQVRAGA